MSYWSWKNFLVRNLLMYVQFFRHNLRFNWLFDMKLVPLESRLKELSIDMWITKIGLKMRKVWHFEFGADMLSSTLAKNRLLLVSMLLSKSREIFLPEGWQFLASMLLKYTKSREHARAHQYSDKEPLLKHPKLISFHFKHFLLSSSLLDSKEELTSPHFLLQISTQNP